jgi:hypothetical protein
MSVPFTRATTVSEADEDEDEAEEDESLEQPDTAGSTISASAAIVARLVMRERGADNPGREVGSAKNLEEGNLGDEGSFRKVMARSLESAAALLNCGGQSRNRLAFAMAQLGPILTISRAGMAN